MGHRALVAYRRPDRRYDLRYSHWGGEGPSLGTAIDAATPLADGAVDSSPVAESLAFDRILTEFLDPCSYELLYVVSPEEGYAVETYRVCWLELDDGRTDDRGAIVETTASRDRALEAWFRATKTTLADVVEMGCLSAAAARSYLESRVCTDERGVGYTYLGRRTEPAPPRTSPGPKGEEEEHS